MRVFFLSTGYGVRNGFFTDEQHICYGFLGILSEVLVMEILGINKFVLASASLRMTNFTKYYFEDDVELYTL